MKETFISQNSSYITANVNEEISSDPSLSYKQTAFLLQQIAEIFERCTADRCPAWNLNMHILNTYSNGLYCIVHHKPKIDTACFAKICNFEKIALLYLWNNDRASVHFNDMDVHCEQDMESISLCMFQLLSSEDSTFLNENAYTEILEVLYLRKEYERMYKIFSTCRFKCLKTYKIMLMCSLCLPKNEPLKILMGVREFLGVTEEDTNNLSKKKKFRAIPIKELLKIKTERIISREIKKKERVQIYLSIKEWFSEEYKKFHWAISMEKWIQSKETEGASEAMLDMCTRFKKYEEGWMIFKETNPSVLSPRRAGQLSQRIIQMIICAINIKGVDNWIERLLEVCAFTTRLDINRADRVKSTLSVLLEIEKYDNIMYIAASVIKQYPKEFSNSKVYVLIMDEIVKIFSKHREMIVKSIHSGEVPELVNCTIDIYKKWRLANPKRILHTLFFGCSREYIDSWGLSLLAAHIIELDKYVYLMCQSIWNNGIQVSGRLYDALIEIHQSAECNCTLYNADLVYLSRTHLSHILFLLEKNQ